MIGLLCLNGTDKVNIMSQDQITNHCFSKQLKVLNTCRLSPLAERLVSRSLARSVEQILLERNIITDGMIQTTGLVIKQYGGTK